MTEAESVDVYDDVLFADLEDEISEEEPDSGDGTLTASAFDGITTYTLDWSVASLLERVANKSIDIAPSYQRRPVWSDEKVWRFFESLMLGLPVPQLVLAARQNARGQFVVLDGKQRLLALRQAADLLADPARKLPRFEVLTQLGGLPVAALEADPTLSSYRDNFLTQPIRTVVVQGYQDDRALHTIFHRLNQNSVSLSPQELRRALIPGPFTEWLDEYSANSRGIRLARRLDAPDFRMRDAETMLRFLAFARQAKAYRGDLRAFLDAELRYGNRRWAEAEHSYRDLADQMEQSIGTAFAIFGKTTFFRWDGEKYIGRFNAAIFDVLTLSFRFSEVRQASRGREREIRDALDEVCVTEPFRRFVTSTTKSTEALTGRLSIWSSALEERIQHEGLTAQILGT